MGPLPCYYQGASSCLCVWNDTGSSPGLTFNRAVNLLYCFSSLYGSVYYSSAQTIGSWKRPTYETYEEKTKFV